ncbi:MAG TPA: hypothetical protein VGN57_04885 [Pirellulaceae bacterium]|jgi:enediyne biosynthesis thioesterase|nr:hypothetical protein [Pirellulaceae bacterium]
MEVTAFAQTHVPRITFEDTNIVGNVYFLAFFRWQVECRDQWLRRTYPERWRDICSDALHALQAQWEMRFEDSFGATIGEEVQLEAQFSLDSDSRICTTTQISKNCVGGRRRIASGAMRFLTACELDQKRTYHPAGSCYSFASTLPGFRQGWSPLDFLGLQGKCRELFLEDHAANTLASVARGELILQTSDASFSLLDEQPSATDHVRVEMRLEALKCGQMGVRFDYFIEHRFGTACRFAEGYQRMSTKRRREGSPAPCPVPPELLLALREFAASEQLLGKIEDVLTFVNAQQRSAAGELAQLDE